MVKGSMFYYLIRVPSDGNEIPDKETVISKLESFNDSSNFLLFDGGDETEKRFILVCENELSEEILNNLSGVFGIDVKVEQKPDDNNILRKIQIIRELMADEDENYHGVKKPLFVTENCSQLLEKAATMIGFAKFKTFLEGFVDYIDRTIEIPVNSMYNMVLINKSDICPDSHIELLIEIFVAKGLLVEQAKLTGYINDAIRTKRETRFVYVIKDDWETNGNDSLSEDSPEERLLTTIFSGSRKRSGASDMAGLLKKITTSRNIYITSMSQEEYDCISALDNFAAAFPHVVTIEELSADEKIDLICGIADEYGFAVNKEGFADNPLISAAAVNEIETTVRKAIQRKLIAKDTIFLIGISDIEMKAEDRKKTSAFDELENLIGLDSVKKTIKEIVMLIKKRGKTAVPCLHMVFVGNPGTGKTTVARIVARIFAETGITERDVFVETHRGGLIGEYVGHTAPKTAGVIARALGGVLFIDEAYALIGDAGNKHSDGYGHEAVATLVKIMEDKRDEFVCILAGYTNEMNTMLDVNPGLRDRISFHIDFPDYSVIELMQIFEMLCEDNEYELSSAAKDALQTGFGNILKIKSQNFSNGRLVRKIFERVRIKQAFRTSDNTITDRDIKETFAEKDIAALCNSNHTAIGFRASA